MPDKTMKQAADELHDAVAALTELLEREYPKREEVEAEFVSKTGTKRRWATVVLLIVVATVLAFFSTVGTISTCFLREGAPGICNSLPGYPETQDRNNEIFAEFRRLQQVTEENSARIDRLENRQ